MAVSLYEPYLGYDDIFKKINSMGIKCNAHVILKTDTIDMLTNWFKNPPHFFQWVNAVIILNYKPVTSGSNLMVRDTLKLKPFDPEYSLIICVHILVSNEYIYI